MEQIESNQPTSGAAGPPAVVRRERLAAAMLQAGFFAHDGGVIPAAADRWIANFVDAFGALCDRPADALVEVAKLRAEAPPIPALELERLRNRQVLFFLDTIGQYVDAQPELLDLPLAQDIPAMAREFGIAEQDALAALRMALTGEPDGPRLELLFPLLGHDRIMLRIGAVASHLLHGRGLEPIRFGPDGQPFAPIEGTAPPR
ncbi:MAG: hypothetical protein ACREM6_15295 [Vulcanimicrobiaceae bacterium]